MHIYKDIIIDISKAKVRYTGPAGKMLMPSRITVESVVRTIPPGRLMTTDLLRKTLSDQFKVQATSPQVTQKALESIANDPEASVPFWRVIRANGELFAAFPDGVAGHAARLQADGYVIDTSGKTPKAQNYRELLFRPTESETPPTD